jgi:hypothetical protein
MIDVTCRKQDDHKIPGIRPETEIRLSYNHYANHFVSKHKNHRENMFQKCGYKYLCSTEFHAATSVFCGQNFLLVVTTCPKNSLFYLLIFSSSIS